jgi:(R,R)-butanediol dehydrogenase / meso-butanediol dehydrogenase / diacetyl reductase
MHAGVLYAPGDLRIEELSDPVPGLGEVLVQVVYNGLCGTDATEYSKGPMMVPLDVPHPGSGHVGPTILGHEFIGRVVDAGADAAQLVGQRVASGAGVSCGSCAWCRGGRTNLCASYYTLGLSTHGGLAELVAAPASTCVVIPEGCSDEDAALAQPLAVGMHAFSRSGAQPGDSILLLGVGAIGSFICSGLAGHDGPVTAADVDEGRLQTARALGATDAALLPRDATPETVRDLFPAGFDVVFETSGVTGGVARALAAARTGGTVVLVGLNSTPQPLVLAPVVLREIDIRTTVAHVCDEDLPRALDLLTRRKLSADLVDRVIPLDQVVEAGLGPLVTGAATGKILVDPRRR